MSLSLSWGGNRRPRKISFVLLAIYCVLAVAGCSSSFQEVASRRSQDIKDIQKVAILVPEMNVYQVSSYGSIEELHTLSDECRIRIRTLLDQGIREEKGVATSVVPDSGGWTDSPAWKKLLRLYHSVEAAVMRNVLGDKEDLLPGKADHFDYTLGPSVKDVPIGADALVIVEGFDHIETDARKQLLHIIEPYVKGSVRRGAYARLLIGVVDSRTGDLLWYGSQQDNVPSSLQTEESARSFMKTLISHMPVGGKR